MENLDYWQPKVPNKESYDFEEAAKLAASYAILSPSAHNTQPWRWEISDGKILIFRDPKYTLKVSDPTLRQTFISIGAFIETFIIALYEFGYKASVESYANTNSELLVATLRVEPTLDGKQRDNQLFKAIPNRHTNRGEYQSENIDDKIKEEIVKIARGDLQDLDLFAITASDSKERVASLVSKGYLIGLSMDPMVEEISELVYFDSQAEGVGMPLRSMYQNVTGSKGAPDEWFLENLNAKNEAELYKKRFAGSPLIIIIGSRDDNPESWLKSGRCLQRALLAAASYGLTHDISAAAVEIPTLIPLLRKEISQEYRPQVLFRLGTPQDSNFTSISVRRPL